MELINYRFFIRYKIFVITMLSIYFTLISACSSDNKGPIFEKFDVSNFTNPTIIGNEWLPLTPGQQWVYEGQTTDEGKTFSHRIEFTVTDLTKEIAGVQTVVALLSDYSDDVLVEKEIAFYAQDDNGDVWFFGEYPEEYEDGEIVKAPTWLAGLNGAKAGIKMRAKPQTGEPSYYQGWGPEVKWSDFGIIEKTDEKTCVPVNCYDNVLLIAESSLDEENAFQLKYYARGVGNVRVGWRGDDETQEELELVKFSKLGLHEFDKIRNEALELERHAYEMSPDMYAQSMPIPGAATDGAQLVSASQSKNTADAKVQKISEEEVVKIALETVPGDVTDVDIERKFGANRYVVEVVAKEDGTETDVIIDMETGEVLGTEK